MERENDLGGAEEEAREETPLRKRVEKGVGGVTVRGGKPKRSEPLGTFTPARFLPRGLVIKASSFNFPSASPGRVGTLTWILQVRLWTQPSAARPPARE